MLQFLCFFFYFSSPFITKSWFLQNNLSCPSNFVITRVDCIALCSEMMWNDSDITKLLHGYMYLHVFTCTCTHDLAKLCNWSLVTYPRLKWMNWGNKVKTNAESSENKLFLVIYCKRAATVSIDANNRKLFRYLVVNKHIFDNVIQLNQTKVSRHIVFS